jgi:hypothetical protein
MIAPPKPPAPDERELLIREARERQLRRRLLGAAGVAVAAAIGLSLYAFGTSGNSDRTSGGSPNTSPGAPLCRASQLSASANGLNGGGFGTMDGPAVVTNVSDTACSLPSGRPRIRMLWRGRILPTRETKGASQGPALLVLAPHKRAAIFLTWSNWCGKPTEGTVSRIRATFLLRFGGELRVDAPGWVATMPGCLSPRHGSVLAVSPPVRSRF